MGVCLALSPTGARALADNMQREGVRLSSGTGESGILSLLEAACSCLSWQPPLQELLQRTEDRAEKIEKIVGTHASARLSPTP